SGVSKIEFSEAFLGDVAREGAGEFGTTMEDEEEGEGVAQVEEGEEGDVAHDEDGDSGEPAADFYTLDVPVRYRTPPASEPAETEVEGPPQAEDPLDCGCEVGAASWRRGYTCY